MSIKLTIEDSVLGYGKGKLIAEVNGNTVGECLDYIIKRQPSLRKALFDESGNLCYGNYVAVNGEISVSNVLAQSVKDEDAIKVFFFAGG